MKWRGKIYKELINTTRWQALRRRVMSAHPLCAECERCGVVRLAQEVHHVIPVESVVTRGAMERLMYDPDNLVPLCRECHRAIHRAMGKGGKGEHLRREQLRLDEFKNKFL